MVPDKYRSDYIRSHLKLQEPTEDFVYKLAETRDELKQAFELLHDSYVGAGFIKPNPSGMRITSYHALPSTAILIAKYKDEVVATITIVRDNPLSLPMESHFDTEFLRKDNETLAEISSLAIKKELRGDMGKLLFPLFNYMFHYSEIHFGIESFVIVTHPKFEQFYSEILLFSLMPEGLVTSYSFVDKYAPGLGFYLNIKKSKIKYAKTYGNSPKDKNLYDFFCKRDFFQKLIDKNIFIMPENKTVNIDKLPMGRSVFHKLFIEEGKLNETINLQEANVLESIYGEIDGQTITDSTIDNKYKTREELTRFGISTKAKLIFGKDNDVVCKVSDVSKLGLKVIVNDIIPLEQDEINIKFKVSEFEISVLKGELKWMSPKSCGIRLIEVDETWELFIKGLEQEHINQLIKKEA